jgi:tetratricopeptide (TPR) repeat protein
MSLPIIILLTVAAALLILLIWSTTRSGAGNGLAGLRERFQRHRPAATVTVIQGDTEIEAPIRTRTAAQQGKMTADEQKAYTANVFATVRERASQRNLQIAALVMVGVLGVFLLPRLLPAPSDEFVVLVAPFRDPSGAVSQTGRSVASELVRIMPGATGERVNVESVAEPPSSDSLNEALGIMNDRGADVLIWGNITEGGMLNEQSIQPTILYRPTGNFAPHGWAGYTTRFAIPQVYQLSSSPINAQVILPDFVGALADYSGGEFDLTLATFDALLTNYPALDPTLPYILRGNIYWARGDYEQAAAEYRRTGVMDLPANGYTPLGMLANNLGAILQDAGQYEQAATAFERAGLLLSDNDLIELRHNWGLQYLNAGNATEAVQSLETARSLYPGGVIPPPPLLLSLAEAYRSAGQFAEAEQALAQVELEPEDAANRTTSEQSGLLETYYRTAMLDERARLRLAGAFDAREPLLWELQTNRPALPDQARAVEALVAARGEIDQAARETDSLAADWSRRATAEDAAGMQINGLIAIGQSRRAEAKAREREFWHAVVETELGRTEGVRVQSGLSGFWTTLTGDRSPLGQARSRLEGVIRTQPENVDAAVLLGRALFLNNKPTEADAQFKRVAAAAPQRPEPLFGQALIVQPNDPAAARQLFTAAIAADPRYFPAREKLAELAETNGDWATAIDQRRQILRDRPSDTATLALANTLRQSGQGGYAEAEQLLMPLAQANNIAALLQLNQLYTSTGNSSAARTVLERARSADPLNADVAYHLGVNYRNSGDLAGAESQFKTAIGSRPNFIEAHLELAQIYMLTGRRDMALRENRAALESGASDIAALKQIGGMLLEEGQYDEAITAYERAREVNSEDAEIRHGLGQAYLAQGRLDVAKTEEQRALDLRNGAFPEAQVGLGDIALREGQIDVALGHYNGALQQNKQLLGAQLGVGRTAAAQGNWSVALAYFRDAATTHPDSADAQLWLGEGLLREEQFDESFAAYQRSLELRPNFPEAYFGIAQAFASANQLDDAEQNLNRALELRPNYGEALLLRGKIYEQRQMAPEAINAYGQSISANNKLAEPRYRRALLYIRTDRQGDATRDLEEAVRIQPNFPEAHYWLGRSYLTEGRTERARDRFAQAVQQRGGNYPEARFYQGLAEEQLGQRENAIESLRTALQQGQGSPWIGEAQAALTRLDAQ